MKYSKKSLLTAKENRKALRIGTITLLIIILSPYLLYVYQYLPDTETWETPFFTLKSGSFPSMVFYGHAFFSKLVPLILLLIWFVDSKSWWFHALLVPISAYMFQLVSVINESALYFDEMEFVYSIPVTSAVLTVIYVIRQKLGVYVAALHLQEEIDKRQLEYEEKQAIFYEYLKYK